MNGKWGFCLFVAVGLAVIGGLVYFLFEPDAEVAPVRVARKEASGRGDQKIASANRHRSTEIKVSKPALAPRKRPAKPKRPHWAAPADWFEQLPAGDRALAKRIQDAQDADNREAVFAAAEEALKNRNAEVRKAAVEALSLQGEAAIPSLLKFIGDGDREVAESAYRAWDDAVDNVESEIGRRTEIQKVLAIATDPEHIASAVGKIEQFEQPRAIRELAKLAQNGGKASAAARDSYENVVGEPFENAAAAELKAIVAERDNAETEDSSEYNADGTDAVE